MNKLSRLMKIWFFGREEEENPLYKGNFFVRNKFILLAFLTPFALMVFGFASSEFYPFGQNQVLVIDMWHQYFPFLNLFSEKLKHFESFFYSWDGALGFNFIGMMSYYAASPIYLLSVFFSRADLTMALGLFVVIKIAFAGAFFAIYLKGVFKRDDMSTVIFSTLYALCAFAMGYYWCLMWLDVLALLPLAILGMIKLMDEGKYRMFTISVAMMLITNYYIAAMTCAFIVLYYFVLYFLKYAGLGMMHFINKTFKVGVFALIGVGISAIMLLPTIFALSHTYYIGNQPPKGITFYHPIMDVLNNLLPNVKLTSRAGLPNIYCGLLSVILGVLFLMCKTIGKKEKVLYSGILGFLILSFNLNQLDYAWHGFKFPNELPFRYSFVFSFVLITMAYTAFTKLRDITPKQIGIVAGVGIMYLVLAEKLYKDVFDYKVIYIGILLLAVYCIVLMVYKTDRYKESFVLMLLFLVIFAECANSTVNSVKAVGNSSRTTYYQKDKEVLKVLSNIKAENKKSNNNAFYRVETDELFTVNPPALFNYRGLSQFNSMINTRTAVMMQQLGYESDPGSNSYLYHVGTPITESMLGINYLVGRNGVFPDANYTEITQSAGKDGTVYGYKFKYPLPIAYMVNSDIKSWGVGGSPFEVQNDFIRATTGINEDLFIPVQPDPARNEENNLSISNADENGITCSVTNSAQASSASVNYNVTSTGSVYAYIGASGAESISVQTPTRTTNYPSNRTTLINLGNCNAGESVKITVNFKSGSGGGFITAKLRMFNNDTYLKAYNMLIDEGIKVTDFSDGYVKGTVIANDSGVLLTSIPYEKGWSAKVDGKTVKITPMGDAKPINVSGKERPTTNEDKAFVAINLKAGKHTVTFSYVPEGFPIGFVIMLFSIALLITIYVLEKRHKEMLALRALANDEDDNEDDEYFDENDEQQEYEDDSIEDEMEENNIEEENFIEQEVVEETEFLEKEVKVKKEVIVEINEDLII